MAMAEFLAAAMPTDRSVLIVEDDKSFLHRLSRAMEGRGFTVTPAQSASRRPVAIEILTLGSLLGQIGLANSIYDFGGKAWTIIGDSEFDLTCAPHALHLDPLVGELDGILQQVAKAVENRRIAACDRLRQIRCSERHADGHAEMPMRRNHLL